MKRFNALFACGAVAGLVLVQPAIAAATRSGEALPLIGVMAASSDASSGGNTNCGNVGDADNVQIDANDNAILDAAGNLIPCRPSGGGYGGGGGGALGWAWGAGLWAWVLALGWRQRRR